MANYGWRCKAMTVAVRQTHVGERLVALREDLGLSQEEAVARTHGAVTLRQWQRWEKGESEPYKRNLAKLSDVFDIPISEFFEGRASDPSQLDRMEAMLERLLELAAAPTRPEGAGAPPPEGELGRRLGEPAATARSRVRQGSQAGPDAPERRVA